MGTAIIGILLLVIGFGFIKDAWTVYRGEVTDPKGQPLWVYRTLKAKVPVAKDRRQALVFTGMSALLCILLGLIMAFPFVRSLL